MHLHDMIDSPDLVAILGNEDKVQAIGVLVQRLVAAGKVDPGRADDVVRALLKREAVGSTGIGQGAAIPHARVDFVAAPVAAIGIAPRGMDFRAPDRLPVRVLLLFLTPEDSDREHLEVLGLVGKLFQDRGLVNSLASAGSEAECVRLIRRLDRRAP